MMQGFQVMVVLLAHRKERLGPLGQRGVKVVTVDTLSLSRPFMRNLSLPTSPVTLAGSFLAVSLFGR